MAKGKLVYKDEAGNKLYQKTVEKYITDETGKRRKAKITQYAAYNAQGKIVDERGLAVMMRRAGTTAGYQTAPASVRGQRILAQQSQFPDYWGIKPTFDTFRGQGREARQQTDEIISAAKKEYAYQKKKRTAQYKKAKKTYKSIKGKVGKFRKKIKKKKGKK